MADLRDILTRLGFVGVSTVLQSGNVILNSERAPDVRAIETAIAEGTGVSSRVVLLGLDEFRSLVDANPLLNVSDDLSKMMITFFDGEIVPAGVERPADADLAPECLVITPRAIYQWCPLGILQSQLKPAWWRQLGPVATARNARTANRILAVADLG
jgi:uncharacterized protein (DUF1697 family)